jgi:hypothetical protein
MLLSLFSMSAFDSDIAPCPKSARLGHQATSLDHQVGAASSEAGTRHLEDAEGRSNYLAD